MVICKLPSFCLVFGQYSTPLIVLSMNCDFVNGYSSSATQKEEILLSDDTRSPIPIHIRVDIYNFFYVS